MYWVIDNLFTFIKIRLKVGDNEKEFIYIIIISKLMECLNDDNNILLKTFKILYEIFIKLVNKYVDKLLIKNKKNFI